MSNHEPALVTRRASGPRGRVLLGSLREFRSDRFLATMERARLEHGDVVRFRVGRRTLHVVSNPDLAHEVLVKRAPEFPRIQEPGKPIGLALVIGTGLLTDPDHDSWLVRRRMIQPMFHRQRIAAMADEMTAAGERMLRRWEERYAPGTVIDVHAEMMRVTLDVINRTMFGADVMGDVDRVGAAVTVALRYASNRFQSPFDLPRWLPTPANRRFREAVATLDGVVLGLIQARREAGPGRGDLLDLLLTAEDAETGERMTDEEVRDEVKGIFGAGHETTANALTWTFALLSEHPATAATLRSEVAGVLGGRRPTGDDLPRLPFTRQVFEEALRLSPPVPVVARRVVGATTLGDYDLPAGSRVLLSISNIHRHPTFWPEPDVFDPDRFSPERAAERHRAAYLPFGAGQHLCIGNSFALMEGPLLLATIAQRYDLRLVPGRPIEREVAITMRPKGGLPMTVQPTPHAADDGAEEPRSTERPAVAVAG